MIADMATEIAAARELIYSTAVAKDAGKIEKDGSILRVLPSSALASVRVCLPYVRA